MNPQYDFLSAHREQMIVQTKLNQMVRGRANKQLGMRGRIFDRLGDVLITSGSWLKKTSQSPVDETSVTFYSQIY